MRRASRTDANHNAIAKAFEALGCHVIHLHFVGRDVPDLLVAINGTNVLVENKTARGKLSAGQKRFREEWPGLVCTVRSEDSAIELVNHIRAMCWPRVDLSRWQ